MAELEQVYSDLENSFIAFLREDPTRTTAAPATMAAKHYEARIESIFAQLKAQLLAALPPTLQQPEKKHVKNINAHTVAYENWNLGWNQALDQVVRVIEETF